jgi:hypothetical protein
MSYLLNNLLKIYYLTVFLCLNFEIICIVLNFHSFYNFLLKFKMFIIVNIFYFIVIFKLMVLISNFDYYIFINLHHFY